MHLPSYALLALGICSQVSVTLAGRGHQAGNGPPAVCNNEPNNLDGDPISAPIIAEPDVTSRSFHRRRALRTPASGPLLPKRKRSLFERGGVVTYDENCNAPLPAGSRYGSGFPTKKDVVVRAYADAVELANQASVIEGTSPA